METDQHQDSAQNTAYQAQNSRSPFYSKLLQNKMLVISIVIVCVLLITGSWYVFSKHSVSQKSPNSPKKTTSKVTKNTPMPTKVPEDANTSVPTSSPTTSYVRITIAPTSTSSITHSQSTATPQPTATPLPTYTISGYVFHDDNGNGTKDAGEQGYAGLQVIFLSINRTATTDSNGYYSLSGLTPGTYNITTNGPGGISGDSANPAFVTISNSNGSADFGFK